MSIRATKWAWSLQLPPTVKLVLAAMADHADEEGECWPLQSRIAEMTGLGDRTVRYVIHGLKVSGLVRAISGKGRRGVFFLALDVTEIDAELAQMIASECVSTSKKRAPDENSNRHEMPLNRHQMPITNRHEMPLNRHQMPMNRHQIPNHRTINNHQQPPERASGEQPLLECGLSEHVEKKSAAEDSAEFDAFWSAYPRKQSKGAARRAFATARKKIDFDRLMAAVRGYDFESQMSSRGDFRKHPASWLNGECWNDDCVAEAVASPHVGSDIAPLTPTSEARFIEARRLWAHQGCNGPVPKRSDFAEERAA